MFLPLDDTHLLDVQFWYTSSRSLSEWHLIGGHGEWTTYQKLYIELCFPTHQGEASKENNFSCWNIFQTINTILCEVVLVIQVFAEYKQPIKALPNSAVPFSARSFSHVLIAPRPNGVVIRDPLPETTR